MYVAFFFFWHGLCDMMYLSNLECEAKYIDLQLFFLSINWIKLGWDGFPVTEGYPYPRVYEQSSSDRQLGLPII